MPWEDPVRGWICQLGDVQQMCCGLPGMGFAVGGFCARILESGKERRGTQKGVECDREDCGQELPS